MQICHNVSETDSRIIRQADEPFQGNELGTDLANPDLAKQQNLEKLKGVNTYESINCMGIPCKRCVFHLLQSVPN